MTLGDQKKLLGTTNLLWSSLDCALLWYKNNFADLLWRIWVLRPTERQRETERRTHTHTTFQRERKETREAKTCRKGRSLVVSFAKVWKKKPNNNHNNPTTGKHCFSVVFPPVAASLFLGFDIYLFLRWEMGVEILLGGQVFIE